MNLELKLLFALALISFIAVVGAQLHRLKMALPMGLRNILLMGTEYLLIGMAMGQSGLNILDEEILKQLHPFLLLALGWTGLLFGLQFEIRLLKKLPKFFFSITTLVVLVTFTTVLFPFLVLLKIFIPEKNIVIIAAAFTLAGVAVCTAPGALAMVRREFRIKNKELHDLLRYIASVDGLWGIFIFAMGLCILAGGGQPEFQVSKAFQWGGLSVLCGVIGALIILVLSRSKFSQPEFLLIIFWGRSFF